jgi:F-type H+/Na+-transporting ATPase subunit alpha
MEILKQPQYSPIPVEKEVLLIFAGNEGFFDKLAVDQVQGFSESMVAYFEAHQAALLAEIRDKRELSDDLKARMKTAIEECERRFLAENQKDKQATA